MLDCTGAIGVEGSWMLSLMEKAVMLPERRVHSHNEDFDGSVSPPGFASVVLLDESCQCALLFRNWTTCS